MHVLVGCLFKILYVVKDERYKKGLNFKKNYHQSSYLWQLRTNEAKLLGYP